MNPSVVLIHHRGQVREETVYICRVVGVQEFRKTRFGRGIQRGQLTHNGVFQIVFAAKKMEGVQERRRFHENAGIHWDVFAIHHGLQTGRDVFVIQCDFLAICGIHIEKQIVERIVGLKTRDTKWIVVVGGVRLVGLLGFADKLFGHCF